MKKFKYADIIEKLTIPQKQKSFWGRETKILKDLLKIFPDEQFWTKFELGFKVNSLLELYFKNNMSILEQKYKIFSINLQKVENNIKIYDEKFGKDAKINKKNNLRNFIDG